MPLVMALEISVPTKAGGYFQIPVPPSLRILRGTIDQNQSPILVGIYDWSEQFTAQKRFLVFRESDVGNMRDVTMLSSCWHAGSMYVIEVPTV